MAPVFSTCGGRRDFRFPAAETPMPCVRELFALMAAQHGVASRAQARQLGVSRRVERRRLADGTLSAPFPNVLAAGGAPITFETRAMAAALATGVVGVSHAAAARLHGLDGFDRTATIDVIALRGAHLHLASGVMVHYTRGDVGMHVTHVGSIPVLTIAATLALLTPVVGIGPTARALDSALRRGVTSDELRGVAQTWRQRGRSGPPALLMLLGERVDDRLPRSWYQRVAGHVLAAVGIRLLGDYPIRDRRGIVLAELDLADPRRRVGVQGPHHDARRRGLLRELGWEVVDVSWSDVPHPERVGAEVARLLRSRPAHPGLPSGR